MQSSKDNPDLMPQSRYLGLKKSEFCKLLWEQDKDWEACLGSTVKAEETSGLAAYQSIE